MSRRSAHAYPGRDDLSYGQGGSCGALRLGADRALAAGVADASPRAGKSVIGGTPASIDQWPFAAAVLTPTTLCTGTVISPTRVLTAGHCVGNPLTMTVRTGSTSAFFGGEALAVESVAFAPGFAHGFENDLAILTLKTPTTATPIQVASRPRTPPTRSPGRRSPWRGSATETR